MQSVTFHTVHTEAHQLTSVIHEAQSITISKGLRACHNDRAALIAPHLLYLSNHLSDGLRCVQRCYVIMSSMQEVIGISSVESLLQVWSKEIFTSAV